MNAYNGYPNMRCMATEIFKKSFKCLLASMIMFFMMTQFIESKTVQATDTMPISNLEIGDKVVDLSWEWNYRFVSPKPVPWIVVAKDHYDGMVPHLTLLSEDLVHHIVFDDSSRPTYITEHNRIFGHNHWGLSGSGDATRGVRTFVMNDFYESIPSKLRSYILDTNVPNKEGKTSAYYETLDKVFIPSLTELGHINYHNHPHEILGTYPVETLIIGNVFPYFDINHPAGPTGAAGDKIENRRRAKDPPDYHRYFTRTPTTAEATDEWIKDYHPYYYWVLVINMDGTSCDYHEAIGGGSYADMSNRVRPIINLSADTPVSRIPNEDGIHLLFEEVKEKLGLVNKWGGDVLVSGKPARRDGSIHVGDQISVGEDSYLELLLQVGTYPEYPPYYGSEIYVTVMVGSNSELTITRDTVDDIILEILVGEVISRIEDLPEGFDFEVRTPVAICGVRGTRFRVQCEEISSRITVLEGQVEVMSPDGQQSAVVYENNELQATADGLGEPYDIDPDDLDQWWLEYESDADFYLVLNEGWNLLSLPRWASRIGYRAQDFEAWLTYKNGKWHTGEGEEAFAAELNNPARAVFVKVLQPTLLLFEWDEIIPEIEFAAQELSFGWNLIGCGRQDDYKTVLAGVRDGGDGGLTQIYAPNIFNARKEEGYHLPWYDPLISLINPNQGIEADMYPLDGYWVYLRGEEADYTTLVGQDPVERIL